MLHTQVLDMAGIEKETCQVYLFKRDLKILHFLHNVILLIWIIEGEKP